MHGGHLMHFSRDPHFPLPENGVLAFTYVLGPRADPLPEPLDRHNFDLNLRLPWEW